MADFFTGLLVIPVLNIRLVVNIREISHPFSVFSEFIVIQVMAATTFSICAVSLDRFTAIVFSMSYERIVTTRRCLRVILAVWASSLIPALPRIPSQTSLSLRGVLLGALLIIIVFPFSVIAFCYMSIFRAARRHRRQINTNTVSPQPPRQVDKAAVTVAMVILIFLSSWIPILCFSVYELVHTSRVSVCKDLRFRLRFFAFSGLLALGSSVCNPVVYTLRYRRLRKVLKSLLCGWREANRSGN
ncbi:predicted protein [Nematostella vectensis]|uniref:G-protein coupled receptors family 1 profile domain-containing protein n=2 Tax=Nematostella vectensis TaxID=45351 RepID=A7SSL7_NEMVE|nr:predicted protein [Nematostella vectensis]|eukprot:XP_001625398.1 predicted protein [Nematostella vectensis]